MKHHLIIASIALLNCYIGLPLGFGQQLEVPVPEGTSKASIERIEERYQKEMELFGELLIELDKNRFRQPADGIRLPVPESVDDEALSRVQSKYEPQLLKFSELLFAMDRGRFKPESDSLQSFNKKQIALNRKLSAWYSELRNVSSSEAKMMMNYVYFCNSVCPRLSSRIIEVGPASEFKTLAVALSSAKPGDTLKLETGTIEMGQIDARSEPLKDIEICGHEAGTTIQISRMASSFGQSLERVRFRNLTFDCQNNDISLGQASQVELNNCTFFNYNSGAGGSNGLSGSDILLLVEDCIFEGKSGRANRSSGGNAFDFRGNDYLCLRKTEFVDNSRTDLRTAVVDNCTVSVSDPNHPNARFQYVSGNIVRLRNSKLGRAGFRKDSEFELAFDEPEFVHALRKTIVDAAEVPEDLVQVFENLQLRHNVQYWIGVIRSSDPEIRQFAAQRVKQLTGQKVELPKPLKLSEESKQKIASLIERLDDAKAEIREQATEELKGFGKSAADQLMQIFESGTIEQKARSKMILDTRIESRDIVIEKEIGRLLNWFDENKDRLVYDKESDTYQIDP